MCVDKNAKPVFKDESDADYRRILEALKSGVVKRIQPGVRELLKKTPAK